MFVILRLVIQHNCVTLCSITESWENRITQMFVVTLSDCKIVYRQHMKLELADELYISLCAGLLAQNLECPLPKKYQFS